MPAPITRNMLFYGGEREHVKKTGEMAGLSFMKVLRGVLILLALGLSACSTPTQPCPPPNAERATIVGYDTSDGRRTTINLWDQYGQPGGRRVDVLPEGLTVWVLQRRADGGVELLTEDCAKRGWVDAEFVSSPAGTTSPTVVRQLVTIDGYDPASSADISPINVWDNYQTRSTVVGRVKTGDQVTLIRRDGDGVLIRLADGTQGWVTYWFIRELK